MESHFHPGGNSAGSYDAPRIHDPSTADAALRRYIGQAINGHLARRIGFRAVWFFAIGSGEPVEQAHLPVDPRTGADAGQQTGFREGANEFVQTGIINFLARAKAARNEK